jgi:hypothetical protein
MVRNSNKMQEMAKRKTLQSMEDKRKASATFLSYNEAYSVSNMLILNMML